MAKTLAEMKAAMQKELEEEQKRLEREEGKRFASSQTSGNSSSGKTSNNTQSSAQSSAAAAQAKANKEADLIGAKDSAKLNSVIGKVPAKSSAAEKAKNSSASGGNLGTSKQAVGDFIAKAAGAQEGIDKIEAAKTEKAAAQAKENKGKDLIGFDGHAYQQQLAQQKEAERLEYLNIKEARDKKAALEQERAEISAQIQNQNRAAGTVAAVASSWGKGAGVNYAADQQLVERAKELDRQILAMDRDINLAERSQNKKYLYTSAQKASDFEEYSKAPPKKEEEQKSAATFKGANQKRETETLKGYMNDEEKAVYNYYLNKFGKEKAEEFVESIEEELNYRKAQAIFAGNEGKVLNEYLMGAQAGLESAKEGYQGAMRMLTGDESYQPTNYTQYLSGMAREDLADAGFKLPEALGGSSIGQIGFDFTNTTANMLPSLILGAAGGAGLGAAAIGSSAAGNAYNSAIAEGFSKEQASNYAVYVGASEAALGYLLGGIEQTGGKVSKAVLGKLLPKIDKALTKLAVSVPVKMASEGFEEYLQETLSPVFRNMVFLEENEVDLLSPEAIYSGFLGALSAGAIDLYNSGRNVSGTAAPKTETEVPEALIKAKPPVPFEGTAQPGTEAGIVADKISEIENRPISEAEKAAKIEEVMEAVAETTQSQEAINEAGKVAEFYKNRQAEFDEAVEIGKKLGISVELDPNIAGNGIHTSDGRIIINPNTENPALQVFVHELTHDIETSGLYESFSKKILEHASQIGLDVNKIREMVIEDYKAAGHDLTDTQADAEIVAKYCEQHLFTDEKAIDRLLSEDRSLFQKIKDWISDMIVKFKGAPEEKFLLEAERLYEKALATRGEVSGIDSEAESVGRGFDEIAAKARDQEYSAAIETGDMETAQRLTDEAAKAAGYDSPLLYHGTGSFGFTEFDLSKMDDKRSIFLTSNPRIASTYSGVEGKREIGQKEKPAENLSIDELAEQLNKYPGDADMNYHYKTLTYNDINKMIPEINNGIEKLQKTIEEQIKNYAEKMAIDFEENDFNVHSQLVKLEEKLKGYKYNELSTPLYMLLHHTDVFKNSNIENEVSKLEQEIRLLNEFKKRAAFGEDEFIVQEGLDGYDIQLLTKGYAEAKYEENKGMGNYGLYANLGKVLEVDASGQQWNNISGWNKALSIDPNVVYAAEEDGEFVLKRNYDDETIYGSETPINEINENLDAEIITNILVDKFNNKLHAETDIMGTGNTRNIAYQALALGYDSVVFKGLKDNGGRNSDVDYDEQADIYVIFDPNKIKSADPVTYDNDGNVIPLSERFKPEEKDIRYSTGRSFDEMAGEAKADEMAADVKTVTMERADKNLDIEGWKSIAEGINPEIGIWRMKDFARVLDNAAGGNKNLRQKLHDLYEKPLNEAQGNYARNYEAKVKDIAGKFKELGIKAGSKESAAVQRIGEGVKEIDKHGNTVPYTLDDLKKDFPDSWQKIKEGADYCRKIYDEFLVDLNTMYAEIYPATVEQANEKVSSYDVNIQNYARHVDNYTEVIKKLEDLKAEKQVELSKKRKDTIVYAELQNQIVNIDKKIEIANERIRRLEGRKFTKQILRDTLKSQIENGEILRNKQITPRKDYFRHFQELTDEFAEIADIFSNDQRIPPNLAGKSETTKPRTIWTSITQSRKDGNYYTEDAVGGLLKYTEIAEKLLVFDPLISHFRDVNSAVRAAGTMVENEVKGKGTNAGQFAAWADDMTNQLAGKTNAIDRFITDRTGAFGRATIKAVEALNRRVKSNAILGNFRSALVQIGNLPNATLYIQNPKDWTAGAISLTNPTEEIKEARAKSNFLSRRYMGDAIDNITKEIQDNNILHKPKEFALWMLSAGDKAAAELIWHTAYSRAINNPETLNGEKGLRAYENAIDYADDITRRSVAGRAEGDIPYFEESKITGLVAPFQIEVANTANALAEQIGKKNAKGIIAFEVGVWLINTVLEGITGDRPLGFDYIDAITDIVKELTGEEEDEEKNAWDKVTSGLGRLAGETISGLPFGAQIGSIISGGDEKRAEEWFGDSDPSRYGTGNIGIGALVDAADYFIDGETPKEFFDLATDGKKNSYRELSRPVKETVDTFAPLLMPWGGKQLARTVGGIDQLISGGAFGKDSNGEDYLKFPQEYDPESVIKTLLFGQYASDRGTEYIDSNFKSLSSTDTANMRLANEYGVSNEDFFDTVLGLKEFKTKEEKQDALFANEDLSAREKSIIDWVLFGDGKGFPEATRDYTSEQAFWESGLSDGQIRLNEDGYNREEIRLIEYAFEKGNNKASTIEWIQKAMDCTEPEAYEIYQRRQGKWIDDPGKLPAEEQARAKGAAELYGMNEENFLKVLNFKGYGIDEEGKFSDKAEDVVPKIIEATGWSKEKAEEYYNRVFKYDYSIDDLEEEQAKAFGTSKDWYGVEDKGYFTARNIIKTAEGTKDEYGNTVSGSKKEAAIEKIAEQLKIDETEATIYYLAANGDLVFSKNDLSSSHQEDLEAAKKEGWTERQYLDAVNLLKVSGATKKDDIIKTLMDGGASYEMAVGYYNLRQNKDYDRTVSTGGSSGAGYSYGMKTQKQADKGDYFLANYNSDGSLSAKDIANWYAAAAGCNKKQEYLDAYQSAGATYSQALKFYNLMRGYDQSFNNYYKQKG